MTTPTRGTPSPSPPAHRIPLAGGGELVYFEEWLSPGESQSLFEALMVELAWEQKAIRIMGKPVMQPRLVAWYGDPEAVYRYSGVTNTPLPWTPTLQSLRARAAATAEAPFNSVLANLYRDGRDSMGFHADNEKELGPDPLIASVSLGAPRRFQLRYVGKEKGIPARDLTLPGGSLLIMTGPTQRSWRHAVPKEKSATSPRINLTFRRIFPAD